MRRSTNMLLALLVLAAQAAPVLAHACHSQAQMVAACACPSFGAASEQNPRIGAAGGCCETHYASKMPATGTARAQQLPDGAWAGLVMPAIIARSVMTPAAGLGNGATALGVPRGRPIFQSNCSYRI